MINKRNLLGKPPFDLGDKDAIHVAIVAVRAARHIEPGQRVGLNEFSEAVPDASGPGVADPFRKSIDRGESFWMLLDQDEVPNVRHVWEHPSVKFDAPTREPEMNRCLSRIAGEIGVTYQQLMDACSQYVHHDSATPYPGTIDDEDDFESAWEDSHYELWSEWADETGYEFENEGSACCPEYDYPRGNIFAFTSK